MALDELDADPTLRLPHALVVELMHDFVDVAGGPSAPLRAGFKLQLGDYELLEYLCRAARPWARRSLASAATTRC